MAPGRANTTIPPIIMTRKRMTSIGRARPNYLMDTLMPLRPSSRPALAAVHPAPSCAQRRLILFNEAQARKRYLPDNGRSDRWAKTQA
jgi:hypothetical protein